MSLTTIAVNSKTHKRLLKLKYYISYETGYPIKMDKLINILIDYGEKHKTEIKKNVLEMLKNRNNNRKKIHRIAEKIRKTIGS